MSVRFTPPLPRRRALSAALAAGALLAACGAAHGQNALGDGRALDANQQVGGGRVNPRRVGGIEDQIRFNNAVIYGNAPGGQSFRGSVGYRAPNEFGGSQPSDNLYTFRRDSVASAITGAGVRASDALRYQFSTTTTPGAPSYETGNAVAGVPRLFTAATAATGQVLRSTSDYVASQTFRPSMVGVRHDQYGAEYVAQASPLLGVNWVKTAESPLASIGGTGAGQTALPGGGLSQPSSQNAPGVPGQAGESPAGGQAVPGLPQIPPTTPAPGGPGAPGGGPIPPTTTSPSGQGPAGAAGQGAGVAGVNAPGAAVPGGVVGATRATPLPLGAGSVAYTAVRNRFEQALRPTAPTDSPAAATPAGGAAPSTAGTPAPGAGGRTGEPIDTTSYEAQMSRLRAMMRGEPWPPKTRPMKPSRPGEAAPPERLADGTVRLPTREEAAAAKKALEPVQRQAPRTLDDLLPADVVRALKAMREQKVMHLSEARPGDVAKEPEAYSRQMADGERLLGEGRYFDAETAFTRALATMSGDPMASAGRIHAQLGAGMFLSAAANLRRLVAEHPEMTGVQYAPGLLPSESRSLEVVGLLRQEQDRGSSALGRDAALLQAYLAYQRNEGRLMAQSLDDFESRIDPGPAGEADRTLAALVRAVWIGGR